MNWPGSLADRRKGAIERFSCECAICGEITTIRSEDFRARREIGKGNDAGVRKVRLEIGKFPQPEQQVSCVEGYVEFSAQVPVHKHFQKRFGGADEISGLGQNRRASEQGHIQREISRPAVVDVLLVKVGDQKSRVSDLRHDASPKARPLVSPFQSTDRAGAPSREDTSWDPMFARSQQVRVDEADRRATQAMLVAPPRAMPSRRPQSQKAYSLSDFTARGAARQVKKPVPPKPPRRRRGQVGVGGRASSGMRGGVSPSPLPERGAPVQNERSAGK